jgi:hypothetical protein
MTPASTDALDLALIGNCQVAALVDRLGNVVWACLPRPDGDPVFCALLKAEGPRSREGVFAVELRDLADARSEYVRNTAVLETTLTDKIGSASWRA